MDMNFIDDDIIIHPMKTPKDSEVPENGILFVNPGEAKKAIERVVKLGGSRKFLHNSKLAVTVDGCIFAAGPSVGAPVAVLTMEKLIVLGAKRVVQMGWCGAVSGDLKVGDVVIPDGAVSGEGTSRYYTGEGQSGIPAGPSKELTGQLEMKFTSRGLDCKSGSIWSTDAPYRESRKQLAALRDESNVVGVDMEFSALCSVAAFRNIEFAAIMIVSDELGGEKWKPGFKAPEFLENCNTILTVLLTEKL